MSINHYFRILIMLIVFINFIGLSDILAKNEVITLKMATLAPKAIGWSKNILKIMHPALDKATNGTVKLKWYWGGTMGDDNACFEHIKAGKLDGAALTGQGLAKAVPELSVLHLPFMFRSYDEVDYIREKMLKTFDRLIEKRGFKLIILADQDFDQIYSTNYPIRRFSDFSKTKILTWFGPLERSLLEEFGANPEQISILEIAPFVRKIRAETFICPALWVVGSQLYTIVEYVTPIKIRYSTAGTIITMDAWNSIPEQYRQKLEDFRNKEAVQFLLKCRNENKRALNAIIKYGVQQIDLEKDALYEMKLKSKKIWYQYSGKLYSKELLNELLNHLEYYRSKRHSPCD